MMDEEEKNRKRKAWITSGAIQMALLLLFYFIVVWHTPDPPNPEFGIELNFGLVNTGSGRVPVTPTETIEEEQVAQKSTAEETTLDTQETTEVQGSVETFENPDPDVVQEETQESSSPQTEVNEGTDTENASESNDQVAEETNPSQGDTGEPDDQGDPEGDINKDALYGTPGGGDDGFSLQMSGWEWDLPPEPDDTSQEAGKIVYEIKVDGDGYLTSYKVVISTVSPSVVQRYTLAIQELTFSKTSSYRSAQTSKGRITFIIRTQ